MKCQSFVYILIVRAGAIRMPSLFRRTPCRAAAAAATVEKTSDFQAKVPRVVVVQEISNLVCFVGETSLRTEPVAMPVNFQSLDDFFFDDENRNIIFSDRGDVRKVMFGDKEMLEIDASVVGLKGLRVSSIALIDAQSSKSASICDSDFPAYTFELVDSRLSATGAAPLVWLFDKLVFGKDTERGETSVTTKSTTTVSCEKTAEGLLVFTGEARIQVDIRIPAPMLKFVSTREIEEQGSQAMQSLLEKEVGPALSRFRDAFVSCEDCTSRGL